MKHFLYIYDLLDNTRSIYSIDTALFRHPSTFTYKMHNIYSADTNIHFGITYKNLNTRYNPYSLKTKMIT